MTRHQVLALAAFHLGALIPPASAQTQPVALQGGRLLTITQGVVEGGTIILEAGRIAAVGSDISIPSGAQIIDVSGMTIMPGLIDGFTNLGAADLPSRGKDDDEATDPVTPHLRIVDAINPQNRFIAAARSLGITAVLCAPADGNLLSGQSALVHLAGATVEEMVISSPVGIHLSLGEAPKRYGERNRAPMTRMGSAALLRQTLVDAKGLSEKLALHERKLAAYRAGEEEDEPSPPERNLKLEALLPVVRGEKPLIVSADRFDDIHTALRIAAEFEVRLILNHGAEAHRVTEELSEQGIPVLWGPSSAAFKELESERGTPATPKSLAEVAVPFAFQTGSTENLAGLLNQARAAVIHGLAYEEALKGLTIYPAQIFGVADHFGSLEVGKSADVAVFDGDPLQELSKVEMVFIEGVRY
ncbi:amidohydrolase family protein [Gemmatimonadota bacterium]